MIIKKPTKEESQKYDFKYSEVQQKMDDDLYYETFAQIANANIMINLSKNIKPWRKK